MAVHIQFGEVLVECKDEQRMDWECLANSADGRFLNQFLEVHMAGISDQIRLSLRANDTPKAQHLEGYLTGLEHVYNLLDHGIIDSLRENKLHK